MLLLDGDGVGAGAGAGAGAGGADDVVKTSLLVIRSQCSKYIFTQQSI